MKQSAIKNKNEAITNTQSDAQCHIIEWDFHFCISKFKSTYDHTITVFVHINKNNEFANFDV